MICVFLSDPRPTEAHQIALGGGVRVVKGTAYAPQEEPLERIAPLDGPAANLPQRRAMQRGQQRTAPGRHAGLGLDAYVQATSPLRRYGDLPAPQQVRPHLRGAPVLDPREVTPRLGPARAGHGPGRGGAAASQRPRRQGRPWQNPH